MEFLFLRVIVSHFSVNFKINPTSIQSCSLGLIVVDGQPLFAISFRIRIEEVTVVLWLVVDCSFPIAMLI
jgi:hypothetical protein